MDRSRIHRPKTNNTDGSKSILVKLVLSPCGCWRYLDENEKLVLKSLYKEGDRSAALIAGSIVDTRLEACLRSMMKQSEKVQERFFGTYGPLGSFSSRIDLAYLLNVISKEAHNDLTIIRNIRNDFAHNLSIKGFKDTSIKDKTLNLKLIDKFVGGYKENETVKEICKIGHSNEKNSQIMLKISRLSP